VDARKVKIGADQAWEILKTAATVRTARGKTVKTWHPDRDDREEILKNAMGPSGSLKAPAIRVGNELLVGFSPELYGLLPDGK
jgi:hypothetical protein